MDDPVYAACVLGDLEKIKRLCSQGQATPFDTTSDGWSLLHVAAALANPALCRWLIEQGLDGNVGGKLSIERIVNYKGKSIYSPRTNLSDVSRTPLMVAADCSGRGEGTYDDFYLGEILGNHQPIPENRACSADILETLRVLVELGQSDPMAYDNYGQNALHTFTGRVEHFNYLFQQEHFHVDLLERLNGIVSLSEFYAHRYWSNSLEISLLAFKQEQLVWEKTVHSAKPQELRLAETCISILHGAANHLTSFRIHDVGYLAGFRDLIKQAVASGADVHGFSKDLYIGDGEYLTPLDRVVGHCALCFGPPETPEDGVRMINEAVAGIKTWLSALREAGVDLKKYIREEERLAILHRKKEEWRGYPYKWYRFNWQIEVSEDQEDYAVSVEFEFREPPEPEPEDRIPGSWIEEE
ncbi:hypothetical protein MMC30_000002 [Trapelia coarctata]|nr:hypothetical protein [Trapelia coarctata]